jgi:hypothetical protein
MVCVLLVCGWSRSGKDTVGTIICNQWGFKRLAFADELKRIICEEYSFPIEWTQTQEGKQTIVPSTGQTVRQLLIKRGQEIRAEQNDPGFFARIVANSILSQINNESAKFVITDWRLPVEFSTIETMLAPHGCKIMKVQVRNSQQYQSPVQDQTTEYQLRKYIFDARIENDGQSLQNLQLEVEHKLYDHIFVSE